MIVIIRSFHFVTIITCILASSAKTNASNFNCKTSFMDFVSEIKQFKEYISILNSHKIIEQTIKVLELYKTFMSHDENFNYILINGEILMKPLKIVVETNDAARNKICQSEIKFNDNNNESFLSYPPNIPICTVKAFKEFSNDTKYNVSLKFAKLIRALSLSGPVIKYETCFNSVRNSSTSNSEDKTYKCMRPGESKKISLQFSKLYNFQSIISDDKSFIMFNGCLNRNDSHSIVVDVEINRRFKREDFSKMEIQINNSSKYMNLNCNYAICASDSKYITITIMAANINFDYMETNFNELLVSIAILSAVIILVIIFSIKWKNYNSNSVGVL